MATAAIAPPGQGEAPAAHLTAALLQNMRRAIQVQLRHSLKMALLRVITTIFVFRGLWIP